MIGRIAQEKTLKISIWHTILFCYTFLVSASLFQVNRYEVPFIGRFNLFFKIIKLSVLLFYFVFALLKRAYLRNYDIVILLSLLCIFLSGIINSNVLVESLGTCRDGLIYWILMKWVFEKNESERISMLSGISIYLVIVCLWNTFYAFLVGGSSHYNRFILGADNESANVYFLACFFSFLVMSFKEDSRLFRLGFIVSFCATVCFTLYMKVGAMLLWVLGMIGLQIYCRLKNYKVSFTGLLIIYFSFILFIVLAGNNAEFVNMMRKVFWGKSVGSRVLLWSYFISKANEHPLLGIGASADKYAGMVEGQRKFLLFGNCHNVFVDMIYHFGYLFFILVLIAIFISLKKRGDKIYFVIEANIFLIGFLFHGIVESGMIYLFIYLTALYYSAQVNSALEEKIYCKEHSCNSEITPIE